MYNDPKIFDRGFSLRQAFMITNLVILAVGLIFTLVLVGVVMKSRRSEVTMRLANEAESARYRVDGVFQEAQDTVRGLSESLPLLMKLDSPHFEEWTSHQFSEILSSNTPQFNIYYALSQTSARKIFKKTGYVYLVTKAPELINSPLFNNVDTFQHTTYTDPIYQTSPKEIWYRGAVDRQDIYFTPFYFDYTYLKRVMISVTQASRDTKTGTLLGVAGVDLTAKSFAKLLGSMRIGKTGGVILTTEDGAPIAPFLDRDVPMIGSIYDPSFETRSTFETTYPGAPLLPREPGLHEMLGKDGRKYLIQSRKLAERPFYVVAYQRKNDAYAELYWTFALMIGLATLFLFISLYFRNILARFVVGNIDKILGNISENRERFSRPEMHPDSLHLKPEGPKEVAKITHQLNLLYARLRASFAEAHQERDRAELATKTKSRFLSVMSHEIRTPLNSMLGLTDVLLLSPLSSEQIRHLRVLQRSGQSLLRILNDILDFSRLEAGKLLIETHEFDLFELLYDVESLMRFDAEAKGLYFRIAAPSLNYRLGGDSIRIRQALLNLVGNAIKFTAKGNIEVKVTALQSDDPTNEAAVRRFQFEVSDTGIGISNDEQSKIFSEFSQADASITRRYGGTGLGLTISKHIIELLGGKLSVSSEVERGSIFQFVVPLEVRSQQKAQYCEISREIASRSLSEYAPPISAQLQKPDTRVRVPEVRLSSVEKPIENATIPAILIVDDDEDNHRLIEAYMRFRKDLRAVHVFSGKEALKKIQEEDFVFILMDMQMPEMDGLDTTAAIRSLQVSGSIPKRPIIMLSANTFAEDRVKSLNSGADEHIGKPIKLEQFKEMLKRWIPGS